MSFLLIFWLIIGIAQSLAPTNQGNKCTRISDGTEGICVPVNECYEVSKNTSWKEWTLCSVDKQISLVCCVSKSSDPPAPTEAAVALSITASSRYSRNAKSMSQKKCQDYAKLVYDGEDDKTERCTIRADSRKLGPASLGEFPHMVSLMYKHLVQNTTSHRCGGSLISEKFVLTAAHCIAQMQKFKLKLTSVMLGALNLFSNATDKPQIIPVVQIIPHPDYKVGSVDHQFDIGLLKLERAPTLGPLVRPACLPSNDENFSSRELVLTGWGKTRAGIRSIILNKAILYEAPYHLCQQAYNSYLKRGIHNESMLCAGHPTGKADSCQGDSGGPLQVISSDAHCVYTVVAVTSFGYHHCGSGVPGVYSRVQYFRRWIENIIWE